MKKLYSLVLMAAALLIGTNTWATVRPVSTNAELEYAWANAESGDVIQLTADISVEKTFWLGTMSYDLNSPFMSLELDLNGKLLSCSKPGGIYPDGMRSMFVISRGELNVTSSVPGGQIQSSSWQRVPKNTSGDYNGHHADGWECAQSLFIVTGADDNFAGNPRNENSFYSHLTIGQNVTINADYINAIYVDYIGNFWPMLTTTNTVATKGVEATNEGYYGDDAAINRRPAYNFSAPYYFGSTTSDQSAVQTYNRANGVRLDIHGTVNAKLYALKVNGLVYRPTNLADTTKSAFCHIYPTGVLHAAASAGSYVEQENWSKVNEVWENYPITTKPAAIYASGYVRWIIEGTCEGASGVVIKSGRVDIKDANISSNSTEPYVAPTDANGVSSQGSAIVVQTQSNHGDNIAVTISGDTKVTATNGYALEETVTKQNGTTAVQLVDIDGGVFEGGQVPDGQGGTTEGTIIISNATSKNVGTSIIIGGGQVTGNASIGNQTLEQFLVGSDTHITFVEDENGKNVMVISEGQGPDTANPDATISGVASGDDVYVLWGTKPVNDAPMSDVLDADKEFAELIINDTTTAGAPKEQVLTINSGVTLKVGRVILGKGAQIIVNPGAKFIVTGEQGIVAPVVSNIVLKASATSHATFLFNPGVTSNRHPNATVEYVSNSFVDDASHYQWERVGIPTWKQLTAIEVTCRTAVAVFENNGWTQLGFVYAGGTPEFTNIDKLDKPFVTYNMISYRTQSENKATYTFKGELVGNTDAALSADREWNGYPNSYMADVNAGALLSGLASATNIDKTIYLPHYQGNGYYTWDPVDAEWVATEKIAPMQAFILRNNSTETEVTTLNYKNTVWNPGTGAVGAPRRFAKANDNTAKLRIVVTNENGVWDNVKMTESATNNHNAVKYMNDDVNIYAMADEKIAIAAAEDLENTYVGFSTVKGGNFTISFANVEGREFTLVDHATGARVAIAEGNTYEFTADANSANDYRFEIVGRQNMPTAIDNTEAVKSVKGVYTITGQYVGEMNVWNTLPAGVYVVNGEKRVK